MYTYIIDVCVCVCVSVYVCVIVLKSGEHGLAISTGPFQQGAIMFQLALKFLSTHMNIGAKIADETKWSG